MKKAAAALSSDTRDMSAKGIDAFDPIIHCRDPLGQPATAIDTTAATATPTIMLVEEEEAAVSVIVV